MSTSLFSPLLPLYGLSVTLEFTEPAEFTFFHQMTVDAFCRSMLGSPENYKQNLTSEAPESGRLHYTLGDYYRFSLLAFGGHKHHFQPFISRLLALPESAPVKDKASPLRNNIKLHQLTDLVDSKPLVNAQGLDPFTTKHLIDMAHAWQPSDTQYPRQIQLQWLSPVRLMRSSEERKCHKLTGEARFCRDKSHLTPALLVQRIMESLTTLISELGHTPTSMIEPQLYQGLALELTNADLFWVDTPYYSKDQADNTNGGMIGQLTLTQTAPIPYGIWQGLILGQFIGVGQRRTSGMGKYQLLLTNEQPKYNQAFPLRFRRAQTLLSLALDAKQLNQAIALESRLNESWGMVGQIDDAGVFLTIAGESCVLSTDNGQLVVKRDEMVTHSLPLAHLQGVLLFGNHHLTTPLIKAALKAQIPIHIANRMGDYEGAIWKRQPIDNSYKHWFLQLQHFDNTNNALLLAKASVHSRLHNMQRMLQRHHKNPEVLASLKKIDQLKHKIEACSRLESLLGIEGSATKAHFNALAQLLPDWCEFKGRNRRPPKDPFNVLLSFGYTWLYAHADAILISLGFLTWKGYYHQTSSGHAALASDVIESYRHIIERAAITAVNTKQIQLEDFRIEDEKLRLSSEARRKYITQLEKRFLKQTNEQTLWQALHQQGKTLLANINHYKPYCPYLEP